MSGRVLEFWLAFASTYSYPAARRIGPLAHGAGVTVRYRPFLLGPIFKAQGWDSSPFNVYPAKGRNMWRDLERLCADLGLPFERPDPFPQNSLFAARAALALPEALTGDFCRSVFRAGFGMGRRIDDVPTIALILTHLKVDVPRILDLAQSAMIKTMLRQQTDGAQQLGIYGAPSFVTPDGELFWGNDRLERAIAWARDGK